MEYIIDSYYNHETRICKDFETKNLDDNHDLYIKNDTLLSADIFENFRKVYLKFVN